MDNLVYLVPLFPLLGFLINGLFRKSLSKSATGVIGSGMILLSFIISILLFIDVKSNGASVVSLFDFINVIEFFPCEKLHLLFHHFTIR